MRLSFRLCVPALCLAACGHEAGLRAALDPVPSCASPIVETLTLAFPAQRDCAFSQEGNLEPRNEHIQARRIASHRIELPEDAGICGWSMTSDQADVAFDDHLAILLDDIVLVSGGSGIALDAHPLRDGLPRFDWADVRGRPFSDRYAPYHCLGEGPCAVPETERTGPLDLEIDPDTLRVVADALDDPASWRLQLLTFGDDDAGDCAHTDLTVQLTVAYGT